MARLPSGKFLIQQIGDQVVLYEEGTEREVVRFDHGNKNDTAKAQKVIYDDDSMSAEDKSFAHFWSGYFHANAVNG